MITIAKRYEPFSHIPGSRAILPGSSWVVQAFPTLIQLSHGEKVHEIPLEVAGPIKEFTLLQDLEKRAIRVFSKSYSHLIRHVGSEILIGDKRIPVAEVALPAAPLEKLFLGVNKQLDWEMVLRRFNVAEILPVLFYLGQQVPAGAPYPLSYQSSREWEGFIRSAFKGILVPKKSDDCHLGFNWPGLPDQIPAISLMQESYRAIRSLFIREEEGEIALSCWSVPSGRLTGIRIAGASIDMEWTKGKMRRLMIHADREVKLRFRFPKEIDRFSYRNQSVSRDDELVIIPGQRHLLDKFQK